MTSLSFLDYVRTSSKVINAFEYLGSFSNRTFSVIDKSSEGAYVLEAVASTSKSTIKKIIQLVLFPITIFCLLAKSLWRWSNTFVIQPLQNQQEATTAHLPAQNGSQVVASALQQDLQFAASSPLQQSSSSHSKRARLTSKKRLVKPAIRPRALSPIPEEPLSLQEKALTFSSEKNNRPSFLPNRNQQRVGDDEGKLTGAHKSAHFVLDQESQSSIMQASSVQCSSSQIKDQSQTLQTDVAQELISSQLSRAQKDELKEQIPFLDLASSAPRPIKPSTATSSDDIKFAHVRLSIDTSSNVQDDELSITQVDEPLRLSSPVSEKSPEKNAHLHSEAKSPLDKLNSSFSEQPCSRGAVSSPSQSERNAIIAQASYVNRYARKCLSPKAPCEAFKAFDEFNFQPSFLRAGWENSVYALYNLRLKKTLKRDPWFTFKDQLDSIRSDPYQLEAQKKSLDLYTMPLLGYAHTFFQKNQLIEDPSTFLMSNRLKQDLQIVDSLKSECKKSWLGINFSRLSSVASGVVPGLSWDPVGQVGNIPFAVGSLQVNSNTCTVLRIPSPVVITQGKAQASGEFRALIAHLKDVDKKLIYFCLLNTEKSSERSIIEAIKSVNNDQQDAMIFIRMPMNGDLMSRPLDEPYTFLEDYIELIERSVLNNENGFEMPLQAQEIARVHLRNIINFVGKEQGLHLFQLEALAKARQDTQAQIEIRQTILLSICVILRHVLINHLQADYYTNSCKDAIDRGGVHLSCDLMWYALLSGQLGDSQVRYYIRLTTHFPAVLAKGWAINHEHRDKLVSFANHVIDKQLSAIHNEQLLSIYLKVFKLKIPIIEFFNGDEIAGEVVASVHQSSSERANQLKNESLSEQEGLSEIQKQQKELLEFQSSTQYLIRNLKNIGFKTTYQPYSLAQFQSVLKQAQKDFQRDSIIWKGQRISFEAFYKDLELLKLDQEQISLILQCCSQTIASSLVSEIHSKTKLIHGLVKQLNDEPELRNIIVQLVNDESGSQHVEMIYNIPCELRSLNDIELKYDDFWLQANIVLSFKSQGAHKTTKDIEIKFEMKELDELRRLHVLN